MNETRWRRLLSALLLGLALAAPAPGAEKSRGHDDIGGEDMHEDHGDHGGEGVVHLTPRDRQELGIEVRKAGPGKLGLVLKVPGVVALATDRVAHVVPRVTGYVREVRVHLGDRVKEGEVMAVLESPELGEAKVAFLSAVQEVTLAEADLARARAVQGSAAALLELLAQDPTPEELAAQGDAEVGEHRALLVSAHAELAFARHTYRREKELHEKQIASADDFFAAESALRKAQAEYSAARDQVAFAVRKGLLEAQRSAEVARLGVRSAERKLHVLGLNEAALGDLAAGREPEERLAWTAIRAPFAGTVIEQHITRGEYLKDDADAYRVADLGTVWVDLAVFPKDVNQVKVGMRAIVSAGDGVVADGKVTYVAPTVNPETRSGLARVTVANGSGAWKPGLFVTGELVRSEVTVPVVVPKSALQQVDGKTAVFVAEGDAFAARPVTLGRSNERDAEVLGGLKPGESYVARGAFALKAHLARGSFDDGHNH